MRLQAPDKFSAKSFNIQAGQWDQCLKAHIAGKAKSLEDFMGSCCLSDLPYTRGSLHVHLCVCVCVCVFVCVPICICSHRAHRVSTHGSISPGVAVELVNLWAAQHGLRNNHKHARVKDHPKQGSGQYARYNKSTEID